MLKENPTLDENYFMTSYLSGLKEELRLKIFILKKRKERRKEVKPVVCLVKILAYVVT
jgi:hypothetical protein